MNSNNALMEAIVLHGVGDLRHEQVPLPIAKSGEALVRIGFCGVCGSDIPRCFSKGTYSFPTICGHEFAGTIESLPGAAGPFSPGDRVVVFPLIWRDDHPACEQGQYAQSDGYDYLGSRSHGAFASHVAAPIRNLIRIPDNVPLEIAAMTEPAAVALHAARRAQVRLADSVAVFGLGPIGLILAQWLRAMGAGPIFLFDVSLGKLDLARKLGFTHVYHSQQDKPLAVIEAATGKRGVHVAFEAVGIPSTMLAALACVRRAGRVVMLGNPSADVTLSATLISQLMRREVEILGTWNSSFSMHGDDDDWRSTLSAMSLGQLDLQPLITHRVPLSQGIKALEMMRNHSEFYTKVLLHPSASE